MGGGYVGGWVGMWQQEGRIMERRRGGVGRGTRGRSGGGWGSLGG